MLLVSPLTLCCARRAFFTPVAVLAAILAGCGGSSSSSSSPAPPQADNIDDLVLETSQFWDSASRGVAISVVYETAAPMAVRATESAVRGAGFGALRASRIALYQDVRRLLADDFGAQFLAVDLGQGAQTLPVGQATRAVSTGCELTLTQRLHIDDEIGQGRVAWRFEEAVSLDDNGGQPSCTDVLDSISASLSAASQAEFPYDLVSLLGLQAVDAQYFDQLRAWTVSHEQVVAKYYRAIGDDSYELAGPAQRIGLDVFESPDARADRLLSQLTP